MLYIISTFNVDHSKYKIRCSYKYHRAIVYLCMISVFFKLILTRFTVTDRICNMYGFLNRCQYGMVNWSVKCFHNEIFNVRILPLIDFNESKLLGSECR